MPALGLIRRFRGATLLPLAFLGDGMPEITVDINRLFGTFGGETFPLGQEMI